VLIGINETGYVRSTEALYRIDEYTRTRNAVSRLLQHVLDAETGSRGYLLTGDPRYLEPYNAAVAEISQNLDNLRADYAPGGADSSQACSPVSALGLIASSTGPRVVRTATTMCPPYNVNSSLPSGVRCDS
jgi:hypothetical protein